MVRSTTVPSARGARQLDDAAPAAQAMPALGDIPARDWNAVVQCLEGTVRAALPEGEARAGELAHGLLQLSQQVAEAGATPELAHRADELCEQARRTCRTATNCSTS